MKASQNNIFRQSIEKYSRMGLASPFAHLLSIPKKLLKQKQVAPSKSLPAAKSFLELVTGSANVNSNDDSAIPEDNAIRKAERARCAKIINHGISNGCLNQACVFAFETGMAADQAIAVLINTMTYVGAARPGLHQRMSEMRYANIGLEFPNDDDSTEPQVGGKAAANSIIRAASKARGELKN